jgi:two-component system sensor histidine kinase/response regulator
MEPIKFLIVDDTPENLIALEALLRRDGLQVLKAQSGAEALELLLTNDIALALLDVQMPEMDGFELAELMRGSERTKHVPIIFVTAGSRDPQRVFKGYEHGAVDFLFKPIDPHALKSKADVFFELYAQRRAIANSLQLSEMFMGILGHDLRNPLGTMVTGAQILQAQGGLDESKERVLKRMMSAGERMTNMISQLLDLTRARLAGGMGFIGASEPLDVASLMQRTADELRLAYPKGMLALEVNGDCKTTGDADRLLQLFSNLVSNALQHGTAGSTVSTSVTGDEREIVVKVRNRGAIPRDLLPTIFDPFRGRRGLAAQARGLGLGLFISQQIAVAHGGSIDVTSSEDAGETTFTVRIPRTMQAASPFPGRSNPRSEDLGGTPHDRRAHASAVID